MILHGDSGGEPPPEPGDGPPPPLLGPLGPLGIGILTGFIGMGIF